jgi:hypothetical protein
MNRLKSAGVVYVSFAVFWMLFFIPVARYVQLNFGLEVGYIRIAFVVLALSAVCLFAWWLFRNDAMPAWLRMVLGYLILLFGTLIVRRALGVWIFRRFVVLWAFALIAAAIYATILLFIRLSQKKKERQLNQALDKASRSQKTDENALS